MEDDCSVCNGCGSNSSTKSRRGWLKCVKCGMRDHESAFPTQLSEWPFGVCEECNYCVCDYCHGMFDPGVCAKISGGTMCIDCILTHDDIIAQNFLLRHETP